MRILCGFGIALLVVTGLYAQNQSGFVNAAPIFRGFGSVVNPAGTSAMPGVTRTTGGVVYPGGGVQIALPGFPLAQPGHNGAGGFGRNPNHGTGVVTTYGYPVAYPVAVPVYGGYGYGYGYGNGYDQAPGAAGAPQQQPNVIVIYPPAPAGYAPPPPAQPAMIEVPQGPGPEKPSDTEPAHYLIAFKDHSIYSAVAYWVDGDTLHYFTTGNTHNQASVSLVDRELTQRLNQDTGMEVKLPAPK